jgi:hypothetical protein
MHAIANGSEKQNNGMLITWDLQHRRFLWLEAPVKFARETASRHELKFLLPQCVSL